MIEERREDFLEMAVHHSVTIFLMASTLHMEYIRIGLMVLYVHDLSDLLGCPAKMFNYCGWKMTAIAFFLPMMAVWFWMRMVLLPGTIMWVCLWEHNHVGYEFSKWSCMSSLVILVCLHTYWFSIFVRMLLVVFQTKGVVTTDLQESIPKKGTQKAKGTSPLKHR
jgi:ceramide synthetase